MKSRHLAALCAALVASACTSNTTEPVAAESTAPAVASAPSPAAMPAVDAPPIALLLSSNNRGEIAPCGCKEKPAGGLARRATVVADERARKPTLLLDGGDALFESEKGADAQAQARARLILEAMGEMGTAAMGVGERDLARGVDWLVKEAAAARVPLLSANLLNEGGERIFEASRTIRVGEHDVGVVGIWGDGEPPAGVRVDEPLAALEREVAKLRGAGADLVVALLHGHAETLRRAAAIEGVDFVVASHLGVGTEPWQVHPKSAWILDVEARGRTVLRLDVHPAGAGPLLDADQADKLHGERAYVEGRLQDARSRLVGADDDVRRSLATLVERLEKRVAELEAQIGADESLVGRRRFSANAERLLTSMDPEKSIDASVRAFEKEWKLAGSSL